MNGQEPAITQQDPRAYYLWLQTQRVPPVQAVQMVQQRFGAPKTPEEQARQQANQAQSNALAQTGGTIGGILIGQEAMRGFPNVKDLFKQPTYDPSGSIGITRPVPGQTLDLDALAAQQQGSMGLNAGSKTPVTPKVIKVEGTTATVELPNGSVQQVPSEALNNQSFWSDIDWGKVGQGGAGALQLYQAYKSIQDKDYAGAGIYGTAGTANVAASGLAGTGAQTAAGEALGGYLVPGANILVGGYGAYKTAETTGSMAAGSQRDVAATIGGAGSGLALGLGAAGAAALAGAQLGVWAGPIGMAVGALAGYAGSRAFGSKKGKAQFMRDSVRSVLQDRGILNEKFQGTLADGSNYDFGKDGSTLKWKEIDKIAEKQPTAWNATVPLTDALAAAYGFVGQKASDISAWYAKGAVSNAKDDANVAIKNAQHFAQQQNITFDQIKAKLDEAIKDERINQNQYDYYLGGARQLTAGVQPQRGPQTRPPAPLPPAEQIPTQTKPSFQDLAKGKARIR
jgi:hypothetical protein